MSDAQANEANGERAGDLASALRSPTAWLIALAVVLASYLYYPFFFPDTRNDLIEQSELFFFEANQAAGAPVLVLALWLFYRRSHYLDLLNGAGHAFAAGGFFAITFALFCWGAYTGAPDLQLVSSLWLLGGVVLLLGGRIGLRAFWLPIVFLAFALPISPVLLSKVMFGIQLVTAQYAGVILNAIGVASFVQGDQILRPESTFVVIETCSGVRTIVTLTMLTVLLIDLFERRGWHAAILIVLAPIVAFLTNGLRVVSLVLNPYSEIASIHNLQGIAMLLIGLTVIYLIDGLIERFVIPHAAPVDDELQLVSNESVPSRRMAARILAICLLLVSMIVAGRIIEPWTLEWHLEEKADELLVRVLDDWPSKKIPPDYNFLGSVYYKTWDHRRVDVGGGTVDVFLAVADEQNRRQTILTPRLAWPASGYASIDEASVDLATLRDMLGEGGEESASAEGGEEARRMILRRGARSVLSYSWYERERALPVEWFRQAFALDRSPYVRPKHILAVRLSTTVGLGGARLAEAEDRIRRVYARLAPELEEYAPTLAPTEAEPTAESEPPRASDAKDGD